MTKWVQAAKARRQSRREHINIARDAIDRLGSILWTSIIHFAQAAVDEFNEGDSPLKWIPSSDPTTFTVKAKDSDAQVKTKIDARAAAIHYAYSNVLNAQPGTFYLQASNSGDLLLICLDQPCSRSITPAEAAQIILEPVFDSVF
jgi:hypothetical protein